MGAVGLEGNLEFGILRVGGWMAFVSCYDI